MKMINKQIEVLAHFKDSYPIPLRCKIVDEDNSNIVIRVDKILFQEEARFSSIGNKIIIYKCQSAMNNMERIFELKYETNTGKWFLYKM